MLKPGGNSKRSSSSAGPAPCVTPHVNTRKNKARRMRAMLSKAPANGTRKEPLSKHLLSLRLRFEPAMVDLQVGSLIELVDRGRLHEPFAEPRVSGIQDQFRCADEMGDDLPGVFVAHRDANGRGRDAGVAQV